MKWLVTGGAGFIGTNLVLHLMDRGDEVVVVDDLSRDGVVGNQHLLESKGVRVDVVDVSDFTALAQLVEQQAPLDAVVHLAGQVSLLASIADPVRDFDVNARGTLNVLECVRHFCPHAAVIGMSSNKVYGDLATVRIEEDRLRFTAPDYPRGFSENLQLDFQGPYGCSKGAADQYLADYGRIFGLRTVSLRQSSVYGLYQHPRSDQGWVAHLVSEACAGRVIRLNGKGKQVRDLLFASDLAELFVSLALHAEPGVGHQFNVGGGPGNSLSILELFDWLAARLGREVAYEVGPMRPSDQKVFISSNESVTAFSGWQPRTSVDEGLEVVFNSSRGSLV